MTQTKETAGAVIIGSGDARAEFLRNSLSLMDPSLAEELDLLLTASHVTLTALTRLDALLPDTVRGERTGLPASHEAVALALSDTFGKDEGPELCDGDSLIRLFLRSLVHRAAQVMCIRVKRGESEWTPEEAISGSASAALLTGDSREMPEIVPWQPASRPDFERRLAVVLFGDADAPELLSGGGCCAPSFSDGTAA